MNLELKLRVGKTVCEFDIQAGLIGVLEMVFWICVVVNLRKRNLD